MRIGGRPFGLLRMVVSRRSSSYTITRETTQKNAMGETVVNTTLTHTADLWLFAPGEQNVETEGGERLQGDLLGMALNGEDLQANDEVTHGADNYRVEDIVHLPHEDDKQIMKFSLMRVNN